MITIEHNGPAGGRPDPNVWRAQEGAVPNELQSYTARGNAFTDGQGHLVLEARRERTVGRYDGGQVRDYSSARLDTKGTLKIQPGSRVEVDALLPSGPGCFPAIWFVGSNQATVGYAAAGELDIVEVAGGWKPDTVLLNAHTAWYEQARQADGGHYQTGWQASTWRTLPEPVGANWHTYGAHFDGNGIRWYLDGQVILTRTKTQLEQVGAAWPFNKPLDLIVNLAVGSSGGDPTDGDWPCQMLLGPIRITQPGETPTPS